jgi:hypothetical protein
MPALVDDEGVLQIQGRHHLELDEEVQMMKGKDLESKPDEPALAAGAEPATQDLVIDTMQTRWISTKQVQTSRMLLVN